MMNKVGAFMDLEKNIVYVPYLGIYSCDISIASILTKKTINKVDAFMDWKNNIIHVLDLGGFAIDIEDNFWDNMFEKKPFEIQGLVGWNLFLKLVCFESPA
jgi:hypothetical protein